MPPAPVSRRERPAKPALTRDGIVAAAVAIMRAEGLDKVTLRRLARDLDTGPASLYVYVRNVAELRAAILDELLGTVDLAPAVAPGDWRAALAAVLASYTDVLIAHPSLARSALVSRPSGPHYLALLDGLLALLAAGGVPAGQAAWGVDLLLLVATATAAEQGTRSQDEGAGAEEDALAAAVAGAAPGRYPQIAALGADLLSGTGPDRLAWALAALTAGIAATPRP
jgi:AcrR family transcriptional regulator